MSALKALHDKLLEEMPSKAAHDFADCPLCAMTDDSGGTVSTQTEEELKAAVDAAVADATAPLMERIKELEASAAVTEVESARAEVRTEMQVQIDTLQTELDNKVIEAEAAVQETAALKTWLDDTAAAAEAEASLVAKRDERLTKVREVASFPEEYLEANADRFAAMADEDFEVALEGWRQISKKPLTAPPTTGVRAPAQTALHASADESETWKSDLHDVLSLRLRRIDPSSLIRNN